MSKNYLSLNLGGKERGLKFNNRTINIIGDLTGNDPLTFIPPSSAWKDLLEYTSTILHAALLSNLASTKEQPDFVKADIDEWLNDLAPEQIYTISNVYAQLLTPSIITTNGEVSSDTRGQATNVAAS
jgi:hypothetical protein